MRMSLSGFMKDVSLYAANLRMFADRFIFLKDDHLLSKNHWDEYKKFKDRFEELSTDLLKFRDEILENSKYGAVEQFESIPGKDGLITVRDVSFRIKTMKIHNKGGFSCTVERLKTETPKLNTEGTKNE